VHAARARRWLDALRRRLVAQLARLTIVRDAAARAGPSMILAALEQRDNVPGPPQSWSDLREGFRCQAEAIFRKFSLPPASPSPVFLSKL